jgi:ATP-dependent Clp protease ATP-binding subunit ClpC
MSTYRFPVLVWEDFAGGVTAKLVEDQEAPAGFGRAKSEALLQLKEYLDWNYQKRPWLSGPDFNRATLINFRVEVRPEYETEGRIFPCDEAIVLRVPCVQGQSAGGLFVCSLPTLDIKFFFQDPGRLKALVTHYTQEKMRGKTPRELSRFLQPRAVLLEEIVLYTDRKWTSRRTAPDLKQLSMIAEPLGDKRLRHQFTHAWERDREAADLVKRASQEKANLILIGEPGVGKTSLLIEAVRQIERLDDQAGDDLKGDPFSSRHKYWMTSGARLISGMQYLGEWQERCEEVIDELSGVNGVLCIENLLELVQAGTGNVAESLATFFLPYLQRGELQMIAEATPTEIDACRRLLPGLVDLFQTLRLEPFGPEQAVRVLNRVGANQARNQQVEIGSETTSLIYRLFRQFQPYQVFPGRSVAFLNELFERAKRGNRKEITGNDVIVNFAERTGLRNRPVRLLRA